MLPRLRDRQRAGAPRAWRHVSTAAIAACDGFNAACPVGTRVSVQRDDGSTTYTATRSEAWILGGHTPVVMVKGIAGAYLLERVKRSECRTCGRPAECCPEGCAVRGR